MVRVNNSMDWFLTLAGLGIALAGLSLFTASFIVPICWIEDRKDERRHRDKAQITPKYSGTFTRLNDEDDS